MDISMDKKIPKSSGSGLLSGSRLLFGYPGPDSHPGIRIWVRTLIRVRVHIRTGFALTEVCALRVLLFYFCNKSAPPNVIFIFYVLLLKKMTEV